MLWYPIDRYNTQRYCTHPKLLLRVSFGARWELESSSRDPVSGVTIVPNQLDSRLSFPRVAWGTALFAVVG